MPDLAKPFAVSFRFRLENEPLTIDRFDAQCVRLIVLDQPFFMISLGANGVVHLYDGPKGSPAHWARTAEGKAWQAVPGTWHQFEAVIDPVKRTYRASLDGQALPARDGGPELKLDPAAAPGEVLLRLASINWTLGDDWRAYAIDDLKVAPTP